MKKQYASSDLWLGTEDSFGEYLATVEKFAAMTPAQAGIVLTPDESSSRTGREAEQVSSRLLEVVDGVAVMSIHGVLTNRDDWWIQYAGMVSYNEIREAAHEVMSLALAGTVKEVLVDVASPGGPVPGVKDAADALTLMRKNVRSTSYTDSVAASGGYWMYAAAGRDRFASEVATLGSIGVIMKHIEYSKAMEEAGVTGTVIRAGEFKQLANEMEPLSEKARKDLQEKADHIYGVFTGSIAELLNVSTQVADKVMGQGKEFIGSQAVEAGLATDIKSFDQVYAGVLKRARKEGGTDMKKKFTAQAVTLEAALGADVTEPEVTATPAPAKNEENPAESVEIAELQAQLKTTSEEAVTLAAAKIALEHDLEASAAKVAALEGQVSTLAGLIAARVNEMLIAAGGVAIAEIEKLPVETLISQYEGARQAHAQLPVGGVAAPSAEQFDPESTKVTGRPALSAVDRARLTLVKTAAR